MTRWVLAQTEINSFFDADVFFPDGSFPSRGVARGGAFGVCQCRDILCSMTANVVAILMLGCEALDWSCTAGSVGKTIV